MHGPNQWPPEDLLSHWPDNVQQYFSSALSLSGTVAAGLALSLSLPEDFFEDKMRDPVAQLLLLKYPPPSSTENYNPHKQQQQGTQQAAQQEQQQQQLGSSAEAVASEAAAEGVGASKAEPQARAASGEGRVEDGSQGCSSCSRHGQAVTKGCGAHTDCGFLTILAQVRCRGVPSVMSV